MLGAIRGPEDDACFVIESIHRRALVAHVAFVLLNLRLQMVNALRV